MELLCIGLNGISHMPTLARLMIINVQRFRDMVQVNGQAGRGGKVGSGVRVNERRNREERLRSSLLSMASRRACL